MRHFFCVLSVLFLMVNTTFADEFSTKQKVEQLLLPAVRVLSGSGGGSGTVIYSEDREGDGTYETFILTNHHVIDNLVNITRKWDNLRQKYYTIEDNELAEVELFSYSNGGQTVTRTPVKAEIVAWNRDEDIAILRLVHPFKLAHVAKLLPVDHKLGLFQVVYAVGCPLLVDPVFTKGEITDLDFTIEKKRYIATSADIIWGNSGGALYVQFEDGFFLAGVPSRVAIAGYQAVTNMGYSIAPERIKRFILDQKLDFLLDSSKTPTECLKVREDIRTGNGEPEGEKSNTLPERTNRKVHRI